MNFRFYLSFLFFFALHHSHGRSKGPSSPCVQTAVSSSDTWDLLNERRGWGTPNFKVVLALSLLNVFSHFLYHIGLEEKMQEAIRGKAVIIAKSFTTLEDECSSMLIPGIKKGISIQKLVIPGKVQTWVPVSAGCRSALLRAHSKGLTYFIWCLIHCPLWFLIFFSNLILLKPVNSLLHSVTFQPILN